MRIGGIAVRVLHHEVAMSCARPQRMKREGEAPAEPLRRGKRLGEGWGEGCVSSHQRI